ncbi:MULTISPECIES: XRE family transcriptional regulator [unclassified Campylobacter]|uniref:XRE family transcriptional regulator n=1 Tax=unclassified Campylobacter TaxID=2593542 RepID=UPI0020161EA0|nr:MULTISPECIES: XRE family transcriptional regulator [unclassified Campylobacter]
MSLTRDEFNNLLKSASLSKREFCDIIGLNYNSINNWGSGDIKVPEWVESWIENYKFKSRFHEVKEIVNKP